MIGRVLSNRYKLIGELGSGGMAWVYLAEDLLEGKLVAVKILYPQLSQDVGFVQRFSQEAKLAMSLSQSAPQKHVVAILDYGSDRDTHYLVMEYVDGRDLRQVLKEEGPIPWRQALEIAKQVALALGHAHQHGIVHRDVKPGNIMLLSDGTVRVLDFGVARARTSPTLTHTGFVGSPSYAAPEQAMGRSVDIRADIYALGVVLYEMLSGELPFDSETPWIIINHHIATPPPFLDQVRPDLPGSVSRLVRRAMSKRPEDRFQTPAAMVQAMEAILGGFDMPMEAPDENLEAMAPLLAGIYQRATEAVEDRDWQEAVDLYSQILKLDPRYRDVTERLAEAGRQARLAALYSTATKALRAQHWAEALGHLDEIAEMAPDYEDVQELRAGTRKKYERDQLYRQAVRHMEAQEWAAAVECLEQVRAEDPHYGRTTEFLTTARAELAVQQQEEAPPIKSRPLIREAEAARQRNWLWAIVAILILALAVESYFFYQSQGRRAPAPLPGLPGDSATVMAESAPAIPATAQPTATHPQPLPTLPAATTASPVPALPRLTDTGTPSPTLTSTPRAERPLVGQIAFPRFDPARGTYDVYICRVDGSNCRRVAAEASQPDFLPDGKHLVLHSWKGDDKGLILQTLSGERVWKITGSLEAARPSVDFQGKIYVFHSREEVDREPRLFRTYDTETRPIRREGSTVLGQSPAWLPDGRILYSGCWQDACGIIVMRSDGSSPQQAVAGGNETNPEASPDGKRVAFMSQRDGNWEVYVANLDGSNLQRLTHDSASDGLPTWSPDGRHIAFVSDREGGWAIWVTRPGGSEQRRLFSLGGTLDGRVQNTPDHEIHGWVEERISWSDSP
jgi:tetratricopeptide (TPR) repeat protein/predicted Ser/Thr protein kinase